MDIAAVKTAASPTGSATAADREAADKKACLAKLCQDFESIFIKSLFKGMRQMVGDSGLLDKDAGSDIFQDMQDTAVAQAAAAQHSLGIGQALYQQLAPKDDDSAKPKT